ncbi:unnamed protein product [Rotaria sp. Silwood1]|nr:unnamed protein product [Rotaria sp. Silwood1]
MLLQCTVLLKQLTSINVTHEEFVKATYNYATDLVTCSSELKELCSQRINQLNKDRDNISLIEPKNRAFMERDPGGYPANYNYTDEERRFFVGIGPFQPLLSNFPRNDVLAVAKDTCKIFHEGSILILDSFISISCLDIYLGPGDQKKDKAWIEVGVNSWSKMKG